MKNKLEINRDKLAERLERSGIEARSLFHPLHRMSLYRGYSNFRYPASTRISAQGLSLPSSVKLSEDDVVFVSGKIKEAVS